MNNLKARTYFNVVIIESFLLEVKVNSHVICNVEFNSCSKSYDGTTLPSSRSDILQRSFQVLKLFHKLNWSPEPLEVHPSLELVLCTSKCHANMFPISWELNCGVWWLRTSQESNSITLSEAASGVSEDKSSHVRDSDSWLQSRGSALLFFFFLPTNLINKTNLY